MQLVLLQLSHFILMQLVLFKTAAHIQVNKPRIGMLGELFSANNKWQLDQSIGPNGPLFLLFLHHRLILCSVGGLVGITLFVLGYLVESHLECLRQLFILGPHVAPEHHALAVPFLLLLRLLFLDDL